MANYEHPASLANTTMIVATSADPLSRGTPGHFTHPIRKFTVEDPQSYMITLVSISLDHPGTGSVYVSTNLAALTRVGSQLVNSIYRIPIMTAGDQYVEQLGSIVQWIPYASMITATEVEIELTDALGNTLAPTGVTTVTLAIRRV